MSTQELRSSYEVIVLDLPKSLSEQEIRSILSEYCNENQVSIIQIGKSSTSAILRMPSQEEADRVIQALNYKDVGGVPVRVLLNSEFTERRVYNENDAFIRGIPSEMGIAALHALFSKEFGILPIKYGYDRFRMFLNYAYVQLKHPEDIEAFISKFDGFDISGKQIKVTRFNLKAQEALEIKSVYATNFPHSHQSEEKVRALFSTQGKVCGVRVVDSGATFRAYINYETREEAELAVTVLDDLEINGKSLIAFIQKRDPKDDVRELNRIIKERKGITILKSELRRLVVKGVKEADVQEVKAKLGAYGLVVDCKYSTLAKAVFAAFLDPTSVQIAKLKAKKDGLDVVPFRDYVKDIKTL